jgi:conjugative relaxase-like TrwC/TraI family protein
MLTPKAQYSVADAKKYFREHLAVGEYYAEGQEVLGEWFGVGAEKLGLHGVTTDEQFERLCDNLHPDTGKRLTLRQKTTRIERDFNGEEHATANRRVFYDFTFSPPKSVSVVGMLGQETGVAEAHDQSVRFALEQLQLFSAARVRKQGHSTDRTTQNIVAAVFRHGTSRALDPHIHSHAIIFNATFDPVERQWKALQTHGMYIVQKFVENVYYHELARVLAKQGYEIENLPRGDFEIKGIPRSVCDKFSKRHQQIDRQTRELLAREPEKASGNIAAIRENIAHKDRPQKVKDVGLDKLRPLWDGQLTEPERVALQKLMTASPSPASSQTGEKIAEKAIQWAEDHLFERHSVIGEHDLLRHALEYVRGQDVNLSELQAVVKRRNYLSLPDTPGQITLREHLQREWDIVCLARDGRGKTEAASPGYRSPNLKLDEEQRRAVDWIMNSSDFVTLFRGGAGTGKSFTLKEVQGELEKAGFNVPVAVPQRQQVMDLEKDGFSNVQTISALLAKGELPEQAVLLVDEAGQIGGKQMQALLELAKKHQSRVLLSGDTRQHGAVEASDALRAIEKYAGLPTVELANIRRQNPAAAKSAAERKRIAQYRKAVEAARDGKQAESFRLLDKLNAIESCTLADRHEKLASRYLELVKEKQSTVIVSQSWNEIHRVNEAIRTALRQEKLIGEAETTVTSFQPVDLTDAQKRDARSYETNSILVFNRDVGGFKAGESARLKSVGDGHLLVASEGRSAKIPFKELAKVSVCQTKEMALAAGDKLQLKASGRSGDERKLANGELVTVKTVHADGRISLTDGRVLDKGFRQFVRGYAITSYASQGKSVNYVLFSDSAVQGATNHQQWYVTISRGKKGIHIFTTDKPRLRENITRSGERPSAMELLAKHYRRNPLYRKIEALRGPMVAWCWMRSRLNRIGQTLHQRQARPVNEPVENPMTPMEKVVEAITEEPPIIKPTAMPRRSRGQGI